MNPFERQKVSRARIMVVGCGALGNEVIKNLALLGVEHLLLVDFDRVEPSNLSRSILFSRQDALQARLKVDAPKEAVQRINPAAEVRTICADVAFDVGLGEFRACDVVVGCVDSRWARYCINRQCMRAGVPWVDGGITLTEGTARVFAPGRNCYACNLGEEGLSELRRRQPCSGTIRRAEASGSVPTTSITASVIGAVQAQEALKIVCGEPSLCGRMFYYDAETVEARVSEFAAWDDDCPSHESWDPVEDSALSVESTVGEMLASYDSFSLHDNCFVDYVYSRADDSSRKLMLPGHKVEEVADPALFYQNEYRSIDRDFPYKGLKLKDLGIPCNDIVRAFAGGREHFVKIH